MLTADPVVGDVYYADHGTAKTGVRVVHVAGGFATLEYLNGEQPNFYISVERLKSERCGWAKRAAPES